MKFAFLLFTLLVSFSLPSQKAWSQEDASSLQQVELPASHERQNRDSIIISVSGKTNYAIESSPDVNKMKEALNLILPDHVREHILQNGGTIPPEVNPLAGYEELSAEKKEQFQKMRILFLQNVARALNTTKFAFGAGRIVGNTLSFMKDSVVNILKKNEASEARSSQKKISFAESSHEAIQATLQALDYKLWNQAPLLLDSNEFGVSASLGVLIENGTQHSGLGGSESLGLSFAYNKVEKAFVFEIFHNSEKFSYTPAVISIAAIALKTGPAISQRDPAQPIKQKTGNVFYPPVVPGFKSEGTDSFNAGFSTSLGFPPIPLVDLLTYSNKFSQNTLIRVTVSPVVKGYIRIYIGDVAGSFKIVTFRLVEIFKWISQRVTKISPRSRSCESVFL